MKKFSSHEKFLGTGLVITLLCCFTPLLVILAGFAGLSWMTGYLDYGLTLLLGFFITALTITLYAHYEKKLIAHIGSLFLLGFIALYLTWGVALGILVIAGALMAMAAYAQFIKKIMQGA